MFEAAAGTTYHFAVDGSGNVSGNFRFSLSAELPPSNDNIADAWDLTGQSGYITGNTRLATAETGEPAHAGNTANRSVWYRWVAPDDGSYDFSTCSGTDFDTVLAAYTGTTETLTMVAANDNWCSGQSSMRLNASEGVAYRIALDGKWGAYGSFRLDYRRVSPVPPNDDFEDAIVVSGLSYQESGYNTNASSQFGEPNHYSSLVPHRSVWYRWTAPDRAYVTLDTCTGSSFGRAIAVYRGETLGTLGKFASASENCGYGAKLTFDAAAGTTYHIAVDGYTGGSGSFRFSLNAELPPSNDNISNAALLEGTSGVVTGSTTVASAEPGEPAHAGNTANRSVWYRWVAPDDGAYDFSTCAGTNFNTVLAAYTGTTETLVMVAANNDWCGTASSIRLNATAGRTYWIAVDGVGSGRGTFELSFRSVSPVPPNDDFDDATVFTGLSFRESGDNTNASAEFGEPGHYNSTPRGSVWYRWTAPADSYVLVDTCTGASFDRTLAVYRGETFGNLSRLVAAADNCGAYGATTSFDAIAGTTYHIAVDSVGVDPRGTFEMVLTALPASANDNIADAEELVGIEGVVSGNNSAATIEAGEPFPIAGSNSGRYRSLWYHWVAPESGPFTFSTCTGTSFESVVAVYSGTTDTLRLESSITVQCNSQRSARLHAVAGTEYWIGVTSYYSNSRGIFQLSYTRANDVPPNDHYRAASLVDGASGSISGTTLGSLMEPIDLGSSGNRSVWYRFTPPHTGHYRFDTCERSTGRSYLRHLSINEDGEPVHVAWSNSTCGNGSMIEFDATEGLDCFVEVLSYGDADFTLRWQYIPQSENPLVVMGQGELLAAALSPDSRFILTSGSAGTYLREAATGRLVRHFREAGDWVVGVAFSPDGTLLATGSYDNKVKLWDIATGRLLRRYPGHGGWVETVAFSPDGTRIVSGSRDKTVRVYDRETGAEVHRLVGHGDTIGCVTYSPDGRMIASAGYDNLAKVWDSETGEIIFTLQGHTGQVRSVAFSPDGTRLVTAAHDYTVRVWDMADGSLIRTITGHTLAVLTAAYTPDGSKIVSGGTDRRVLVWDAATGARVGEITAHTSSVLDIEFSRDGSLLFTASRDLTARLWNLDTLTEVARVSGHTSLINTIAVSPDGTQIVSGAEDGQGRFWDPVTGLPGGRLEGHFSQILEARYSPEGTHVLTGSRDGTARLWEVSTGLQVGQYHESSYRSGLIIV